MPQLVIREASAELQVRADTDSSPRPRHEQGRGPFTLNPSHPLNCIEIISATEAGDGDRTRTKSLEGSCAAITPRPRMRLGEPNLAQRRWAVAGRHTAWHDGLSDGSCRR